MTESLPMIGTLEVRVLAAQPVSIHGDMYFDLSVSASDANHRLRVPNHLCERPPRAGDRLALGFLMQQVTSVAFLA